VRFYKEIILALALASAPALGQSEPERYSSREYGIYFDVPAGWTLDRKPASGLVALSDSLGLLKITVTAQIMAKKADVREFAKRMEGGRKGAVVAELVDDTTFPEAKRNILEPFVYDDTKKADKAREEHEKAEAKRPVAISGEGGEGSGSIPDDPQFLAEMTTRLYEGENQPTTELVFYVIGGGVGYTVTVAAARDDFYAVLPLAHDAIMAMGLDRLSGGRYALPDAKALEAGKLGIIMGKVLKNGRPIAGAAVNLYSDAACHSKGVPSYRARSNGYGEYSITHLDAGRYYRLEVYGVSDEGERVRSVQPITNIDVVEGRIVFVNIEVSKE
jgi:hypothetical protein